MKYDVVKVTYDSRNGKDLGALVSSLPNSSRSAIKSILEKGSMISDVPVRIIAIERTGAVYHKKGVLSYSWAEFGSDCIPEGFMAHPSLRQE